QPFEPVYSDSNRRCRQSRKPSPRSTPRRKQSATPPDISWLVMNLFLAIDAGGTKTRCLLANESQVLARATTGSVKLMRVGEAEASARLQAMLKEVSLAAGVDLSEVTQTCIGIAGLTIEA